MEIHFVVLFRFIGVLITLFSTHVHAQEYYMLAGTYDSPLSEGIYVYRFDAVTGIATKINSIKTSNPSFLAIRPDNHFVFSVNEHGDGKGTVSAFTFNKQNGMLTLINSQASGGDHPCHVELDKTGRWLFVSNYSGGTLSILPVNRDGSLGTPRVIRHYGSGKHPSRQQSPHVHGAYIAPGNKQLLVTDLGTDEVKLYDFDEHSGKVVPSKQSSVKSFPGSGPRSLSVDEVNNKVMVLEELTGTVSIYSYNKNKLKFHSRIFTNPKGDSSFAGSAHIEISPDNKFLYTSSRGEQNAINVYIHNKKTGYHFVERISSLGKSPRNFSIDPSGNWLLCANQNSNEIVIFKRDQHLGTLTDSKHRISVGRPVCIKWIKIK